MFFRTGYENWRNVTNSVSSVR